MRTRNTDIRDERGQVIVLVSAALFALLLVVGMVIDVGIILEEKRQLQNAADAAALAAASAAVENPALAQSAAEEYLLLNGFDPADTSLVITVDPNYSPTEVEVTVVAVVPTAFFTIAGVDSKTVTVRAVGEARPVRGARPPAQPSKSPATQNSPSSMEQFSPTPPVPPMPSGRTAMEQSQLKAPTTSTKAQPVRMERSCSTPRPRPWTLASKTRWPFSQHQRSTSRTTPAAPAPHPACSE